MVRVGLCLYLMFATVAGPLFCCCTLGPSAARPDRPAKQESRAHGCCQHHTTTVPQDQTHQSSPEQRHRPADGPSCPCRQDGSRQAVLTSLDSEVTWQLQSRQAFQALVTASAILPATACLSPDRDFPPSEVGGAWPFLTAQDILCALHILRC